ncbi:DUF3017 domain-containing protein [Alloscardovia theropitheci]|uniref:DUF3017 domain-containing protein n=1 Tax=Alloscardovia theropitheci TaxID=2496842 RepID=A0A4R0QTX2_9BIFI|nr:DUF3017 domain-containing protein [Alloscardovia theropitheci]TCD54785.1 DUF3017 domain-containing protein [Alloscardovia theropitheci]
MPKSQPHHIQPIWPSLTTVVILIVCSVLAWFGFVDIATYLIAAYALVMGIARVILRDKSPWKVRSVIFDSIISFGLAIGLVVTYISIILI